MRVLSIVVACLLCVISLTGLQAAEGRRVAVVIGVSDYGGQGDLANPARDAAATADTLTRLGYDVRKLVNPSAKAVDDALDGLETGQPIQSLLFYFSGHGRRVGGASLLALGVRDPRTGERRSLALTNLIARFETLKPDSTLFVLDACRTETELKGAKGEAGLAPPPRATGTFFAYSAAPGGLAFDSAGRTLSPFTYALVDELLIPEQDIGVVMRKVRERVSRETAGRQIPWSEDVLTGQLVINAAPSAPELFNLYGKALKGDAVAERELGLAYLNGQGVAADVERGSSLLRSAAGRGDTDAMLALGGFEATRDQNALKPGGHAREWYSKAANAGSAEAMYRLATLDTKTLPEDRKPDDAAITLYRRAMEAGHRDAAARYLGLNLRFGFDKTRNRAATISALRENAAAGNLASMVELGRLYSATGAEQDVKEAGFWLDRAIAGGSADALLEKASLSGQGIGQPVDLVRAHDLTQQAAERGSGRAMLLLGRQLQQGKGVAVDPAAAVPWFRKAIATGETEAFADLGYACETGLGTDRNLGEAVELYKRGAALNNAVATRSLAVMYEQGLGVRRNMDRAVAHYIRAAELGDGRAEASLAVLASNGMLTSTPDPALGAAALAKVTARSRDADYTLKLAQMTEKGVGRRADMAEAVKLYKRAASLGSAVALAELAALYKLGQGVPKDIDRAVEYWQKSAEAGDPESYYNLAVSYAERGDGADNQAEAGRWARRGAEAGNGEAMTLHARNLYFGQHGQARDVDAAFDWLERGLAVGNGWAAGTLVALATDDKINAPQPDRDRALLTLVRAVDQNGNAVAAEALRLIYKAREGVDMNAATEEALIRRLDGPQRGMAALLLGLGFQEGRFGGGKPNGARAAEYYRLAIDAGEVQAYRHLGDLHAEKRVPQASAEEALRNYKLGAEKGDPAAMNDLGVTYRYMANEPDKLKLAFQNFKDAAERGHVPAMHNLAVAYQRGFGVAPSPEQAEQWYERAIAGGHLGARFGLANVLLNAPEDERDYTRAFFNLAVLGRYDQPVAATTLGEIAGNATLPRGVRERAVMILAQLQESHPKSNAQQALQALVSKGAVKRTGKSYELVAPSK